MENKLLKVGISLGDFNGIGPEIIIKAISDSRVLDHFIPVVYGSPKVISFYKKMLGLHDLSFNFIKEADQANNKKPNLVVCWEEETEIKPGIASAEAGKYAALSLRRMVEDAKAGKLDLMVTAPIDKHTIQSEDFNYPGHTEYFAAEFGEGESMMLLVGDDLRVGLVTGHLPLSEVSKNLSKEGIIKKIGIMDSSLRKDFGIRKPRIAVLGLNPHAGDSGLIGKEEIEIIGPAVEEAYKSGLMCFGPYSADGFFGSGEYKKFDGVLAMYHDQGLIPFKYISFFDGVNYTAGLPVVRTSPDHGTAYGIAGKGEAEAQSLSMAIYLGLGIIKNRREEDNLRENPLKFSPFKRERFRMDF